MQQSDEWFRQHIDAWMLLWFANQVLKKEGYTTEVELYMTCLQASGFPFKLVVKNGRVIRFVPDIPRSQVRRLRNRKRG